jgi:hypothetical protein
VTSMALTTTQRPSPFLASLWRDQDSVGPESQQAASDDKSLDNTSPRAVRSSRAMAAVHM